jgi:hypothetical protein
MKDRTEEASLTIIIFLLVGRRKEANEIIVNTILPYGN